MKKKEVQKSEVQKNEVQKKEVHHTHSVNQIDLGQLSSTELKRNAKGETEIRVKVYSSTPKAAMEEANRIYATLTKKYKFGK